MSPAWLLTALRRLRLERASAIGLSLLVLVTSGIVAATPRFLDRLADAATREEIAAVPPANRGLQFTREGRIVGTVSDPLSEADTIARDLAGGLVGPIGDIVVEPVTVIDSVRWTVGIALPDPTFLRFRVAPGVEDRVTITAGRAPGGTVTFRPDPASTPEVPLPDIAIFEIAVSAETATTLHVGPGSEVPLTVDPRDPLAARGRVASVAASVVGIFEAADAEDPWWYGDTSLIRPNVRALSADVRLFDTTGWLSEDAFGTFMGGSGSGTAPARYVWRFGVVPERLEAEHRGVLIADLRRLEATYPPALGPGVPTALRSGLRPALEASGARWSAAEAVLTVVAIGPASVALGSLVLVAVLAAQRRRSALALARGRGADSIQIGAAIAVEGVLLAVPAAGLGAVAAILLVPADPTGASLVGAAVVALAAIVILVGVTVPGTRRPGFGPSRDGGIPRRPTARRFLIEGAIVVGAIAGAWLLRERGVSGGSTTTDLRGADPVVAAVPALLGLAAGIILARGFPAPTRLLVRLARAGRGLVGPLGFRRASSGAATTPLLAVLLAASAAGAFSAITAGQLDRGAEVAGWARVGAPYRLTSITGGLGATFDPFAMPGVTSAAVAGRSSAGVGTIGLQADIVTLDVRTYEAITAGTPAGGPDLPIPIEFFGDPGDGPLPAIVSRALTERPDGLKLGTTTRISVEGYTFEVLAVEVRDDWPAMTDGAYWIVIDRVMLQARFPAVRLQPQVAFLAAPDDTAADAALRAFVAADRPGTYLDGRAALTDELRALPAARAIRLGLVAAAIIAGSYALLGVAAALALAGAARSVEASHLRTLGLDRRGETALVVLEHGPVVLVASSAGVILGAATFLVLRASLGLEALTGISTGIPFRIGPAEVLLALGAGLAITALGIALGVIMQRAVAPTTALRRGFE